MSRTRRNFSSIPRLRAAKIGVPGESLQVEKDCCGQTSFSERQTAAKAALGWVRRSIETTGGNGSSHSFSPFFGWAKAYPETTGYLIPTLLRYADLYQDDSLRQLASQCRDWLLGIQLPCGAWAGGLAGGTKPSVFNTAMILWGVAPPPAPPPEGRGDVERTLANTTPPKERGGVSFATEHSTSPLPSGNGESTPPPMERGDVATEHSTSPLPSGGGAGGGAWLLSALSPDGAWRSGAYLPGFVPSYYTYAVWSMLEAGVALNLPEVQDRMRPALHYYAGRFRPDGTVQDWGLKPGNWAFTHTIAYTLQGFLESALLLGESNILEKTVQAADGLLQEFNNTRRAAGRYGLAWRGDYSFTCPVGNAQLSIFYRRLWETTKDDEYARAADAFLSEALRFQNFDKNPNTHGALPGSAPFWGPYLRWRYPNWGVKFLLDALATTLPPPVPAGRP